MSNPKFGFLALTLVVAASAGTAPNRVVASRVTQQTPEATKTLSAAFALKPLGHNVYAAIDTAKGEAGANAGFLIGDDGVAVFDTFENPDASKQLLAEIRKLTQLPIKFVINTHYHIDHVAGNSLFQQNAAVVFAQRNVRTWIHTENLKFFGKDIKPEQRKMVETLGAPDAVYDTGITLFLGSRRIDVRVFPGHTGGDSVVFVPDANVVFTGDLFWRNTLPNLIDATTSAWIPSLNSITDSAPDATYVPGHGDVGNAGDVKNFRDYLAFLREHIAPAVQQNKAGDDLVNSVLPAVTEKYGKWDFFKFFAKPDILHTAAEIRGDKKIPQPEK
jgi:glyoxylase-like metal-dependent hydrolase (beta-lactamase superfamily II)